VQNKSRFITYSFLSWAKWRKKINSIH